MNYLLEATVFATGAVVMIVELVGSRVLAPYVGSSLPVWTSIIGVVLGSLSIGYWWGGRLADKKITHRDLSHILLIAAFGIANIKLFEIAWLGDAVAAIGDVRTGAVVSAVGLFSIPNIALGMISPYAVSLRLRTLARRGSVVGNLSALSTIGSIVGTFIAGFVLIPTIGHSMILLACAMTLIGLFVLVSSVYSVRHPRWLWVSVELGIVSVWWFYGSPYAKPAGYTEIDTEYNRVWVRDEIDRTTGRKARVLLTDATSLQSGIFLDNTNHYYNAYLEYFLLAERYAPDIRRALMIGGGANSFAKYFHARHPQVAFDIAEIDPGMTQIAKDRFYFRPDERLAVHHEDGRMYLRNTRKKYDVIYVDAFSGSLTIPYHLLTREAMQLAASRMSPNGVLMLNTITPLSGDRTDLIRSVVTTLASVFPYVDIYKVEASTSDTAIQNVILAAAKHPGVSPEPLSGQYERLLSHRWSGKLPAGTVLTDELAPVEYLTMKVKGD